MVNGHVKEVLTKDNVLLMASKNKQQKRTFKLKINYYCLEGTWFDDSNNKGAVKFYKFEKLK
jgi:hypothetical protein